MAEKPKKDDPETRDAKKGVVPAPADPAFADWFESLFDGTFPSKIELVQLHGTHGNRRGMAVDTVEFKGNNSKKWTKEECTLRSNEWMENAQRNCNGVGAPTRYGALATNMAESPAPYKTYVLSMKPKYEIGIGTGTEGQDVSGGGFDSDTAMTGPLDPNRMMLERFKEWGRQDEWRIGQAHSSMGGMLKMQQETIFKLLEQNTALMEGRLKGIELVESAMTKVHERNIELMWQQAKISFLSDGVGAVKQYLLPEIAKIFQKGNEETLSAMTVAKKFIESLTPEQGRKSFGIWQKQGQEEICVEQGLFTPDQCHLLVAIADGKVPASAATDLIKSVTPDQMQKAMQIYNLEQLNMLRQFYNANSEGGTPSPTPKSDAQ